LEDFPEKYTQLKDHTSVTICLSFGVAASKHRGFGKASPVLGRDYVVFSLPYQV
jgi:hypothetical protein